MLLVLGCGGGRFVSTPCPFVQNRLSVQSTAIVECVGAIERSKTFAILANVEGGWSLEGVLLGVCSGGPWGHWAVDLVTP